MSSFSALLSSLQDGKSRSTNEAAPEKQPPVIPRPVIPPVNMKRRLEDDSVAPRKAVKLSHDAERSPAKATQPSRVQIQMKRPAPLNGSMKSKSSVLTAKPQQPGTTKAPVVRPSQTGASAQKATVTTTTPAPVKRGFASLLAKANAAQEAVKAAGPDTIKHKATEVMKKKERERLKQEARIKEKQGLRGPISIGTVRNSGLVKSADGQPVRRLKEDLSKVGSMRAKPTTQSTQSHKQKNRGQDKYGGYAAWSDLDEASDEDDEEDYESGSDMEEAGFDDMMEEEERTTKIAKLEDQRELADEEQRRKEKLERKKRLMALSNNAAAAKKRY